MFITFLACCVSGFTAITHRHEPKNNKHRTLSVRKTFPSMRVKVHPLVTSSCLRETSTNKSEKPKELTPDSVAEMAEVSFVNACLQLAKGYVDVLKLFIVAVKAGYELNISSEEMIERIDTVSPPAAGRDLMAEEVKLRNTWIRVIYLVLETLQHEKKVEDESEMVANDTILQDTFSSDLLSDMKTQHEAGETFQLEHWLDKYSFPNMDNPMEKAIISQSLRVIWFVFTVLQEEQVCLEEKSGLKAQPPIPGAFEE